MEKQQVINFALNNDKFELLTARVNRFNPFKILKIEDHEIRHSNVLAWIFNPNENHNFDDRILKRFLLKVLLKPANDEILENMDFIYELQQKSFMDMKVYRELKNIDLVLISEQQQIVIFIENKVYSDEHSNQLTRYYEYIKKTYPSYQMIPIFLTLEGKEASNKNYFSASYDDLLETLDFIINHFNDRTSSDVITFLQYYVTILKEKYVVDESLKRLCKEIYQENKDVIDMIYSIGNEIDMEPAIAQFIEKYDDIVPVIQKSRAFWFGIKPFLKARKNASDSWGGGFPICFWFSDYNGNLKLTLEVGPFDDANKRITFLNRLEANGIRISERAKQPGRKYTRIFTKNLPINDWGDVDEVCEKMEKLYENKELSEMKELVVQVIDNMDW